GVADAASSEPRASLRVSIILSCERAPAAIGHQLAAGSDRTNSYGGLTRASGTPCHRRASRGNRRTVFSRSASPRVRSEAPNAASPATVTLGGQYGQSVPNNKRRGSAASASAATTAGPDACALSK